MNRRLGRRRGCEPPYAFIDRKASAKQLTAGAGSESAHRPEQARGSRRETMTYSTEDFVHREVGSLLRSEYRGKSLCSACLVKMTLERLHRG